MNQTFDEVVKELEKNSKTFESNNFLHCVNRAILLLKKLKAQIEEDGYVFCYCVEASRWAIKQSILNRKPKVTMMAAAIEYIEKIEENVMDYNGIRK